MCKEGNVRGIFGYPEAIEELAKEYRISPEKIEYIIFQYGSMDAYIDAYRNSGDAKFEKYGILRTNVRPSILIDLNDITRSQTEYVHLYQAILNLESSQNDTSNNSQSIRNVVFYDGQNLKDALEQIDPRARSVIKLRFGLEEDGKRHSYDEIAKILGYKSHRVVEACEKRAMQRLRTIINEKQIYNLQRNEEYDFSEKERAKIDALLGRIYASNLIFIPDSEYSQEQDKISPEELRRIASELDMVKKGYLQRTGQEISGILIEELGLDSDAIYRTLRRAKITNIQELMIRINNGTFENADGLGTKKIKMIKQKLEELNSKRNIAQKDENGIWIRNIGDSDFAVDIETYRNLIKANINTEEQARALMFIGLTGDAILNICAMDETKFDEFVQAIIGQETDSQNRISILREAGIIYNAQLNAIMTLGVDGLKTLKDCQFSDEGIAKIMEELTTRSEKTPEMLAQQFYVQSSEDADIGKMVIDNLNFSLRTFNRLKLNNINTVADLISKSPEELGKINRLGAESLKEIDMKKDELRNTIFGGEITELSLKKADKLRLEKQAKQAQERANAAKEMFDGFKGLVPATESPIH